MKKRFWDWTARVAFWVIPIGTIAAIWHFPLWKVPVTAFLALFFIFTGRVLVGTVRELDRMKKESLEERRNAEK